MRSDGTLLPGLFAIGNDIASVFKGSYPGGGTPLGLGMTFRYIAGQILVEEKRRP